MYKLLKSLNRNRRFCKNKSGPVGAVFWITVHRPCLRARRCTSASSGFKPDGFRLCVVRRSTFWCLDVGEQAQRSGGWNESRSQTKPPKTRVWAEPLKLKRVHGRQTHGLYGMASLMRPRRSPGTLTPPYSVQSAIAIVQRTTSDFLKVVNRRKKDCDILTSSDPETLRRLVKGLCPPFHKIS